jgi:CheY-like chemotaxis protein
MPSQEYSCAVSALPRRHVVLAEDNLADVVLVREAFREHGVDCVLRVIPDGEQLLSFIDGLNADHGTCCPDLLLLDLSLPKYDGWHVLEYLRSSTRCAETPVIVMSSSGWPRDRQNAEKHAAVHYFQKPTSLQDFMRLGGIVKGFINAGHD